MPASLDHDDVSGASHSDCSPMPERLGIYRIESLLGRGGMGEVYLAWDELLERHVAIKRVLGDRLGDDAHRARFLREARAVARLDHPAIVRVHHVLERDDDPCLVMEFVRGNDFSKLPAGGLPMARVVSLARGVAEGLEAAHARGLVHRDLKLANLMATPDGGVKILDFGLAVLREPRAEGAEGSDADAVTADPTGSGVIVGTVHAMSPEQATGAQVDHRSDLFSFGSLLYELLSGESPFAGSSMLDTLRRVVTVAAEPVEQLAPGVPPELARLVAELLDKDRDRRPASARQVAERLASIARSLPGAETPGPVGPPQSGISGSEMPTAAFATPPPDPASRTPHSGLVLRTVVHVERTGESDPSPTSRLASLLASLSNRYDGVPASSTDGGGQVHLFFRPAEAVAFALSLHDALAADEERDVRIGIHLGEVSLAPDGPRFGSGEVEIDAFEAAAHLARRAAGRQTLVGRSAFDLARGARAPELLTEPDVRWLAHGAYLLGSDVSGEPYEIFEVGREGVAPLRRPGAGDGTEDGGSGGALPVGFTEEVALGWRPAIGQSVPRRPGWQLAERLGEGGFGEVWLARHEIEGERVFKFCFEPDHLRALKRELTLFRLLRETLGHRRDIARVLDWDFDEVPYFLESEYTDGGDLSRWAGQRGGLPEVPLATRLELVAQVADALAAAHSVGVLHKDVKPANVLVGHDDDGRPEARLTDFGIGLLTDRSRLNQPGFTVLGFTEATLADTSSTGGGTVQYMAPELLEGKPATIQADVYSLGVLLYQTVVGDFDRALATGWQRDLDDPLLAEDVAACVDGAPDRRLRSPEELATRLRSLAARREERSQKEEATLAEKRTRRRRRIASWLGGFAAVLLLVVSIFAYQTNKAREQAEQRRRQAENLIDFLLGDLRAELQPIGKLDVLDKVGDEAMEYFSAVSEEQLSPEEMANYAKALHQIGQVRFALGKIPEATETFGESLAMAKRLAASDPQNADWQFQLGQSHFWLGYLHWQKSDFDSAGEQFEAYRRVSEHLVARDPGRADWQLELAYSYSNLGSLLSEQGQLEKAVKILGSGTQRLQELLRNSPNDSQLLAELANTRSKLGVVQRDLGRLEEARMEFEAAANHYSMVFELRPGDMEMVRTQGTVASHSVRVQLMLGDDEGALQSLQQILRSSRKLVEHEPENRVWLTDLVQDLSLLAEAQKAIGNFERASESLASGREILDQLLAEDPGHRQWRFLLARNRWLQSQVDAQTGQFSDSLARLQAASATLDQLRRESDSSLYALWAARTYAALGEAELAMSGESGIEETAAPSIHRGLQIANDLVTSRATPEHVEVLARLLVLADRRSEAASRLRILERIGYRPTDFRDFLQRNGLG